MTPPSACRSIVACAALALAAACRREAPPEPRAATAPAAATPAATPAAAPAADMPTLRPEELARVLGEPGDKPLLFHVGFRKLYEQAHIPGSEYLGPTADADALDRLRKRVADLPRTANIVIYCGCCPWDRCPNVKPAYRALRDLGFGNAKVLLIPHDLGSDWVDHGFPVARGD